MKPLLMLALFLLSSCTWLQSPAEPRTSPPTYYPLQTPGSYGGTFTAQNLLEGQYERRRIQLQTHVEIDADQIVVVGLTPWQTRAFVLRYDGQTLDFENFTHHEMPFPPALILSDLQQVLWPALPSTSPWRVEDDGHPGERRIYFRNQLITRIQYAGQSAAPSNVMLWNFPYGYQLNIRTLHQPPLPRQ
jgi:hypothetical protein